MDGFIFEMWRAKRSFGFLVWDKKWGEWDFIEQWAWDFLSNEHKEELEIIKEFKSTLF